MTRTTPARTGAPRGGLVADLVAVGAGALLVIGAALVGRELVRDGQELFLGFPPVLATWAPHLGPGTPLAVVTAVGVVVLGPGFARRAPWWPLLAASWAAATAWTLGLALVDGWQEGVVARLTSDQEYLWDVPRVTDIGAMLRGFSDLVRTDQPGHWVTHVGAHPPGVFLLFVWLDRIGLGGGGPAGIVVILVGASTCAAVAVTLRALGHDDVARAALPFLVLLPGAVWVGVSADGMFAAVLAWGVALFAVGATATGRRADVAAFAGGVLLGYCLYLSYGLGLGALLPAAVLTALVVRSATQGDRPTAASRPWRALVLATAAVVGVVAAFTVAGFWWFTGFADVRVIYAASAARTRPYEYFVWANMAAFALATGPAVLAGLRRLAGSVRALPTAAALLVVAALLAVVIADLSGMSKAEVERIWLPFGVWLVVACAVLPRQQARGWLAAQAGLALAVNHLLLTAW